MHSSSNTTDLSQQELSQYNQPLYANAPPKPRRLNDAGYSSPSPDLLERYTNQQNLALQQQQQQQGMRVIPKSPVNIYNPEYVHRPKHEFVLTQNAPQNMERRTPDTYGRSRLNPKVHSSRNHTDYEDVYAEQNMYKRPLSPVAYSHVKKTNPSVNPAYRAYTPVNIGGFPPAQMRKSPNLMARPHSADFLEYELNHRDPNTNGALNRQPRPKSSLDINRNTKETDNYFYSEERYAENMRKSAQYLPKMPRYFGESQRNRTPVMYGEHESNAFPLMRSTTQPIPMHFANSPVNNDVLVNQPVRSRSVLSEGSLSKELDVDLRCSPREHERNGPYCMRPELYGYDDGRSRDYEQFARSASARLPQNGPKSEGRPASREGDRKVRSFKFFPSSLFLFRL